MYKRSLSLTELFATAGDASADRTTSPIETGTGYTGSGFRHASVHVAVENVGTPVGVVKILVGDNPDAMVEYPANGTPVAIAIPAGAVYSCQIDNIETTCRYIAVMWDRTSGGTGAAISGTITLAE